MSIEGQYVQCPRSSFESRFTGEERNVYSKGESPQPEVPAELDLQYY